MNVNDRKSAHIHLALESQLKQVGIAKDQRFFYEPLLGIHAEKGQEKEISFLQYKLQHPLWISSMTGGAKESKFINLNLARAAREFGLGMGLGSTRVLLKDRASFSDFDLRDELGDKVPLMINLGIAQIDQLIAEGELELILRLKEDLRADGLVVHVNPLQEFLQPEGDRYKRNAFSVLSDLMNWAVKVQLPVIVKEVGQGMGPMSLELLLSLPLAGIELGAFGGTNFSQVEIERSQLDSFDEKRELVSLGHTAEEMVGFLNSFVQKGKVLPKIIISGGIRSPLHAYYLRMSLQGESLYGLGGRILRPAMSGYDELEKFLKNEFASYALAEQFLRLRSGH